MRREIEFEQRHVDRAYRRLEEIRSDARAVGARALAAQTTSYAARTEREGLAAASTGRVRQLQIGDEPLVLGRLDRAGGERLHVGRVGVTDRDHEPLVVDWRAPAAEPFYRATGRHPMGVLRRRHLLCRGPRVVAIDDEILDAEGGRGLVLVGEAALLRAVQRSRSGRMRDIVATIQAEQDEIIRAPLEGVLVVQGAPGTGKTAVALHRAAYLLYTHRPALEHRGVLLVGPNPTFLRYVEHVLPSLGEHAVRLATLTDLVDGVHITRAEPPAVARLKGDVRMAKILARAVRALPQSVTEPVRLRYDGEIFSLLPSASRRIIDFVHSEPGTHNARRRRLRGLVLRHLADLYRHAQRRSAAAGDRGPVDPDAFGREERVRFYEEMLADPRLAEGLEAMWPETDPAAVVGDLASHAEGVCAPDEVELLAGPQDGWTAADVPLLDEAAVLLGPRERPPAQEVHLDEEERWAIERMLDDLGDTEPIIRAEREQLARRYLEARVSLDAPEPEPFERETFGHVLVDEAQELSPMAWRMLARRCPSGSMTVVGDLAQASGATGASSWPEMLDRIGFPGARVVDLTVNYRTPAEIMELAGGVLARVPPGARLPRSVRRGGEPAIVRTTAGRLAARATRAATAERAALDDGTLAVIAPPSMVGDLRRRLGTASVEAEEILDAPLAVLDPQEAKGLEFDVVVLVEPAALVEESPNGFQALYVSLTRPTRRLVIVHARGLPDELAGSGERGPTRPAAPAP